MRKRLQLTLLVLGAIILVGHIADPAQTSPPPPVHQLDANRDGRITPSDALAIIEYLNDQPTTQMSQASFTPGCSE